MFDPSQSLFSITGGNLMKFGGQKVGPCCPQYWPTLDERQLDGLENMGQSPTRSNEVKHWHLQHAQGSRREMVT